MKRHPTDGTLRRLVDEPAGVADADREHVAGCPECLTGLAAARRDASAAEAALRVEARLEVARDVDASAAEGALRVEATLEVARDVDKSAAEGGLRLEAAPDVDAAATEAAWHRLSRAVAGERPRQVAAAAGSVGSSASRWRATLRSPVFAVVAVVALLTGASAAAATNWLPIFRAERIAPVTAPQVDLAQLPELESFGEVKVTEQVNVRKVADAAEAEKVTGLSVPRVSGLPRGVTGEPTYLAGGRASAVFTFSAAKAAQFVASAGGTPPQPPAGLDGSQFQLVVGPGVAAVWAEGRPMPAMIVARVTAPTVYSSSGIPFETARDYLLSLPGLPANIASQLRGFSADGTTLPLFVSTDKTTSSAADVNGVQATVLTPKSGVMAAVVWVERGVVTGVAGSMNADEVLSVARGLRWSR